VYFPRLLNDLERRQRELESLGVSSSRMLGWTTLEIVKPFAFFHLGHSRKFSILCCMFLLQVGELISEARRQRYVRK
jgi:hypothetical protein